MNIEIKEKQFSEDRGKISYYCKDCKEIVEVEKNEKKKFDYICTKCNGKEVVIGTFEGLKSNYKIK
ncbi:MAG: hypothetical protein Q9M97_04580 [Candidatus Gracilibacteria bacterium]|nr:hypothetical protein [Candidatus Gracilibacteria bacterium]